MNLKSEGCIAHPRQHALACDPGAAVEPRGLPLGPLPEDSLEVDPQDIRRSLSRALRGAPTNTLLRFRAKQEATPSARCAYDVRTHPYYLAIQGLTLSGSWRQLMATCRDIEATRGFLEKITKVDHPDLPAQATRVLGALDQLRSCVQGPSFTPDLAIPARELTDLERLSVGENLLSVFQQMTRIVHEPADKSQGARLYDWRRLLAPSCLSFGETHVLWLLCASQNRALKGQKKFRRAVAALVAAKGEDAETATAIYQLRAAKDMVCEDTMALQALEEKQMAARSTAAADAELWRRCEQNLEPKPALARMALLARELDHSELLLKLLSGTKNEDSVVFAGVQWLVDEGRRVSATDDGQGVDSKLSHLKFRRHLRQLGERRRRQGDIYEVDGDGLTMVTSNGVPVGAAVSRLQCQDIGRKGALLGSIVGALHRLQHSALVVVDRLPAEIAHKATQLLADVDATSTADVMAKESLANTLRDLRDLAHHFDQEARADGLLFRQMEVIEHAKPFLVTIGRQLGSIEDDVRRFCKDAAQHSQRAATKKRPQPREDRCNAEVLSLPTVGAAARGWAEEMLPADAAGDAEIDGARCWEEVSSRGRGRHTLADYEAAKAHFSAGTFPSPWASARYHFRKHGAASADDSLLAYVTRAIGARGLWGEAVRQGTGRLRASLLPGQGEVRVISSATTWLVMTHEANPKIISYRDRGRCSERGGAGCTTERGCP